MAGQIKFFRKNHIDLDRPNISISVSDAVAIDDGADSLNLIRNRNNNSGWMTTTSDDSANTELLIDLGDYLDVDMVMLVKHNFKSFLVEYYDNDTSSFQTYENISDNSNDTSILTKSVNTDQIKITIYGTIIADSDKILRQLIITENFGVGEFEGWPQIKRPTASLNKKVNRLLSGKVNVVEKRGAFSVSLEVKFWIIDNDLTLVENIYYNREGVLMLISGGNEDQFASKRIGYRNEDIVLVRPVNELELPYNKGIYKNGIKVKMDLEEVVF